MSQLAAPYVFLLGFDMAQLDTRHACSIRGLAPLAVNKIEFSYLNRNLMAATIHPNSLGATTILMKAQGCECRENERVMSAMAVPIFAPHLHRSSTFLRLISPAADRRLGAQYRRTM